MCCKTIIRGSHLLDIKKKLGSMRLVVVAIGSYASIDIGRLLGDFIAELWPQSWDLASFSTLISFSITGFIFGMCLWLLYEKSAKQLVKFIPLFSLPALFIWINFLLQEYSIPVTETLSHVIDNLTEGFGLYYLIFLPLSVWAMILLLERYSYKQIAQTASVLVVALAVSRFIYTLTPQYQQEQIEREKIKAELQRAEEEVQRAFRQLERAREGY